MWNKDRLAVVLLLASFALMGAECTLIHQKTAKEKRLPDRADVSANGLVRTYYNTATMPSKMTDLKIPEGTSFDDNELTVNFEMGGGTTVVTDVRARLMLIPPKSGDALASEIQGRIISPTGLSGAWQDLPYSLESDSYDPQVQLVYTSVFDGELTGGTWKIQLRDPVDDKDGRMLFRNGTLILNRGTASTTPALNSQGSVTLDVNTTNWGVFPEINSPRAKADIGFVGIDRASIFEFSIAGAAVCTGLSYQMNVEMTSAGSEEDLSYVLISPNGGWIMSDFPTATTSFTLPNGNKLAEFNILVNASTASWGSGFPLLGADTSGTWTLAVWDNKEDNIVYRASPDGEFNNGTSSVISVGESWTLEVFGE
ncbi:MAG: hypothetical protein L3J82_01435 [Planctomycetes bacterium]|nr:hypothetical protein [Planctomycetota bacterium]